MKKYAMFVVLCIVLGVIALCSQGCKSAKPNTLAEINQKAERRAIQKCLMAHRREHWPNLILYPEGEHPCFR